VRKPAWKERIECYSFQFRFRAEQQADIELGRFGKGGVRSVCHFAPFDHHQLRLHRQDESI
jgi:hypothetical protein